MPRRCLCLLILLSASNAFADECGRPEEPDIDESCRNETRSLGEAKYRLQEERSKARKAAEVAKESKETTDSLFAKSEDERLPDGERKSARLYAEHKVETTKILEAKAQRAEAQIQPAEERVHSAQAELDACAAPVRAEHEAAVRTYEEQLRARAESAATTGLLEIIDRPTACRVPEEQARLDSERAKCRAKKTWPRPFLTALLCRSQQRRSEALKEIAEEKKYSQIGGAVNTVRLYALQQEIRSADKKIEEARSALAKAKLSPERCNSPIVSKLIGCIDSGAASILECEPEAREYLGLSLPAGK